MVSDRRVSAASSLRSLFHERWSHILELLGWGQVAGGHGSLSDVAIGNAMEAVVDGTDPRVRIVGSYLRRLRASARVLLDYLEELANDIPDPIVITRAAFTADAQLNAFFVNADDMLQVLGDSRTLRSFLKKHSESDVPEVYALLLMRKQEKRTLGMGLRGDVVVRDMVQTAVNFSSHRICAPCATVHELRQGLKQYLFDRFVAYVRREMQQAGAVGTTAEASVAKNDEPHGPTPNAARATTDSSGAPASRHISRVSGWEALGPKLYLDKLAGLLGRPHEVLKLQSDRLVLNKMGLRVEANAREAVNAFTLKAIALGERTPEIIVPVIVRRDEVPPPRDYLTEASKRLETL